MLFACVLSRVANYESLHVPMVLDVTTLDRGLSTTTPTGTASSFFFLQA
jgi:hypothetical protein